MNIGGKIMPAIKKIGKNFKGGSEIAKKTADYVAVKMESGLVAYMPAGSKIPEGAKILTEHLGSAGEVVNDIFSRLG